MYKMDGRGGCCIARYAGGGAYDMSKVDRIMLRFRPIAPKPATGGSVSPTENSGEPFSRAGKGKRKYSRENSSVNKRCNSNRKRKASNEEKTESVVTLPLLPDSPARSSQPGPQNKEARKLKLPVWLSFDRSGESKNQVVLSGRFGGSADRTVVMMPQAVRVVGSSVTVECVTDTWVDGDGLGSTDEEKRINLGRDTCPGFVSDEFGRVTWTNEAYRKMVGQEEGEEMVVWLVMKAPVTMTLTHQAFTCRVRLQYSFGKDRSSLTLPCDVWRMDAGGFAWRLDVKAALSLGR
ncbi:von willebrand factor A domain protein [Melia azedarach]|uniref:von willebrand factor A domain protein n=1 Tax=Melia azedarach TaxID=155640 RepID=A0ACC1XMI3_MELAZ|nr:von willebrand factor A domain protein [Melia azedarach]